MIISHILVEKHLFLLHRRLKPEGLLLEPIKLSVFALVILNILIVVHVVIAHVVFLDSGTTRVVFATAIGV